MRSIIIKLLLLVSSLVFLSSCGWNTCLTADLGGVIGDPNCFFMHPVNLPPDQAGSIAVPIPPLPDPNSLDRFGSANYIHYVNAADFGWLDTGITINNGDMVMLNIQPSSLLPPNGNFVANGTINQCYTYKNYDFSTASQQKLLSTSLSGTGPTNIVALFNNQYKSCGSTNYNCVWQYAQFCPINICRSLTFKNIDNCPATGFYGQTGCTARDGQGLFMMLMDSNNQSLSSFDYSSQFEARNTSLDPLSKYFRSGAMYFTDSPGQNTLNISIGVPQMLKGSAQSLATNYNLSYVTTGCFGVNGVLDVPNSTNPNAGQLQYFIGWNPKSGDGSFAPSNAFMNPTGEDNERLYLRIYESDNATDYQDNVGQYEVQISITPTILQPQGFVNIIVANIIPAIASQVQQLSEQIFNGIVVSGGSFQGIATASLVLYIIVYGIAFMLGATKISQHEVMSHVIKMAIVLALFSKNSILLFNEYFFNAFTGGLAYLAMITSGGDVSNAATPYNDLFHFATVTVDYLTDPGVIIRILTFILLPKIGIFLFGAICSALGIYIISIIEAFIAYLLALTGLYLFIALGPFFFVLALFNRTKEIFKNWVHLLANFVLQTMILFSCIALVNSLVLNAFNNLLMESKYTCIFPIQIGFFWGISYQIGCFLALIPSILDITNIIALSIILVILITFMKKMPEFVKAISRYITDPGTGGIMSEAKSIASKLPQSKDDIKKSVQSMLGIDKESKDRRESKERKELGATKASSTD